MIQQRILKNAVSTSGVGVHSGANVQLTLHPADAGAGIIFRRVDLNPIVEIPALTQYVGDTRLNTSLVKDGAVVSTVEHILSAFAGVGIDNAYIDLDGPEMPVLDGSAVDFITLIQKAGIKQLSAPKLFLVISSSNQKLEIDFSQVSFIEEISRARTFGFLSEYDYLKKNNLARGAGLENTVVLDETKILNEDGLRYKDEFVKHKILDAIGDLYLVGHSIIGAFSAHKSGHKLNDQLRRALTADPTAWEIITLEENVKLPISFDLK